MPKLHRQSDHWEWKRIPDPKIINGFMTPDLSIYRDENVYCPSFHRKEILDSIIRVYNESDAIEFVKQWGLLGIDFGNLPYNNLVESIKAVIDYELYKIYGSNWKCENIDRTKYADVAKCILEEYFKKLYPIEICNDNINNLYGIHFEIGNNKYFINLKGDYIEGVMLFAEYTRRITEIKYLLNLLSDDPYIAMIETDEWINKHYDSFFTESERMFFPKIIPPDHKDEESYKEYLSLLLVSFRFEFNKNNLQKVFIKFSGSGHPLIKFDGLHCFILFYLLTDDNESILIPKKCSDEKCGNLFFPREKGNRQRYCPALFNEKRSRCEQRDGQRERRKNKREISSL